RGDDLQAAAIDTLAGRALIDWAEEGFRLLQLPSVLVHALPALACASEGAVEKESAARRAVLSPNLLRVDVVAVRVGLVVTRLRVVIEAMGEMDRNSISLLLIEQRERSR